MKEHFGNITLINDSWENYLPYYEDKEFGLAFPDPQYGIGADNPTKKPCLVKQKNGSVLFAKGTNYPKKEWDNAVPPKEYFEHLFRVSQNQIIWGVNYYPYDCFAGGRIVWNKLNGESDQFDCEIAYNSYNNRTDIVHYMWAGMFQGSYCGKDLQKALIQQGNKQKNEKRIHPCQKPVKLYKWFLKTYVEPGTTILDTHGGSMNLAKACFDLDYPCVIIEKDYDYFSSGLQSFIDYKTQQKLFHN